HHVLRGREPAVGPAELSAPLSGGRIVQSRYLQFNKKDSKKVPGLPSSGVAQRKAEKVREVVWTWGSESWGKPAGVTREL
uniref:Uncharacterized protein n=1 Tax=Catharus ustulatus TaxID=91951 RepID=A0A8C3UDW3_CATUS